jgi:hypothetical protein
MKLLAESRPNLVHTRESTTPSWLRITVGARSRILHNAVLILLATDESLFLLSQQRGPLRQARELLTIRNKLIDNRAFIGGLPHAMDTIHRARWQQLLRLRQDRVLCRLGRGRTRSWRIRTWIGAVIEHSQTLSGVALRKMVESFYSINSL